MKELPLWYKTMRDDLTKQRDAGRITAEQYKLFVEQLHAELTETDYRQEMKDAGRGHLLR